MVFQDAGLAAAHEGLAKIGAVIPASMAPLMLQQTVAAPNFCARPSSDRIDVAELRTVIRGNRKMTLDYADEKDQRATRVTGSVMLACYDLSRVLGAWCEMRKAFRHVRTDRMLAMTVEAERYPGGPNCSRRNSSKVRTRPDVSPVSRGREAAIDATLALH
jgi:predicted DNA-binding transcriptional regulator YafY